MASSYQTEIGKLLRSAREDLRLTLQEVSGMLHIRSHYLQALESGDLDNLPGAAYTKGYLQAYAAFLHLDKDEILRRFELVEDEVPAGGLFFPQVFSKEQKPSHRIVWGAVLVMILIYLSWFVFFRPELAPISVITPPPSSFVTAGKSGSVKFNHPCSVPQVRLYPPCYWVDGNSLSRRRVRSVMELVQ